MRQIRHDHTMDHTTLPLLPRSLGWERSVKVSLPLPGLPGRPSPDRGPPDCRYLIAALLGLGLLGATLESAALAAAPLKYSKPIVIRYGGTYRGNWESLDPKVPAVTVATAAPVVIEYSNIRGRGALIYSAYVKASLTIRHTRGVALTPDRPLKEHRFPGRFLELEEFRSAVIQNNEMIGTSGMYFRSFLGQASRGQTIKILNNRARNIDGRYSTGLGKFSDTEYRLVQFVQFNDVKRISNAEIAWNEVINEPGRSRVEENISMYLSSGVASSVIKIHDNYIQGSYNIQPTRLPYSGGAMNLADGSAKTPDAAAAYIRAYNNQVVNTSTGIVISAGHDILADHNRLIASGYLPDGRTIAGQNVGLYVWDIHGDKKRKTFYNNVARDNVVGWATPLRGKSAQNPYWFPDCSRDSRGQSLCTNNQILPGPIPQRLEKQEAERWQTKLKQAGMQVGPVLPVSR